MLTKSYVRTTVAVSILVASVLAFAVPSFAVDPTPSEVITTATTGLSTELLAVIAVVLGIAVTFFAIKVGWRWVTRFIR
jgi:type IV secretory pathway VirB2 component (pilin)